MKRSKPTHNGVVSLDYATLRRRETSARFFPVLLECLRQKSWRKMSGTFSRPPTCQGSIVIRTISLVPSSTLMLGILTERGPGKFSFETWPFCSSIQNTSGRMGLDFVQGMRPPHSVEKWELATQFLRECLRRKPQEPTERPLLGLRSHLIIARQMSKP